MHSCRLIGCKNIKGQSWRLIKNLPVQPLPGSSGSRSAALAIFFATSNFDLKYFCSLLTYKNVKYLIWKIWFISVWSLKPKAEVWLLTGFMLGQSTLISYHTEANGYIFFAAGVYARAVFVILGLGRLITLFLHFTYVIKLSEKLHKMFIFSNTLALSMQCVSLYTRYSERSPTTFLQLRKQKSSW